jgi:hypothetical protein
MALVVAGGCTQRGAEPAVDLTFAVGAVAECRGLTRVEATRRENAARASTERALAAILSSWLVASDPAGGVITDALAGVDIRVEVVLKEAQPAVVASVQAGARRVTVPLAAARRGAEDDPQVVVSAEAVDDPGRLIEVGFIDARGRISLTACGERWSLTPVAAAGDARATPRAEGLASHFGGRPLAWWQARLSELKREGSPALYALALTRARAAGLAVEERPDGVTVAPPARGASR